MAVSIDDFHTAIDAVVSAVDSESWSTAYKALAKAELQLLGLRRRLGDERALEEMASGLKSAKDLIDAAREVAARENGNSGRFVTTRVGY